MSGVRIQVNDAAVQGAFARLFAFGSDQTPAMRAIGAQLRQHVDKRFEDERGPGGMPWPKSWRAREQNGQTLTDTARLRQSMTFRAGPQSVEVGTNVRYAAVHQFGATIRAKTAKGLVFRIGGVRSGGRRNARGVLTGSRLSGGGWRRMQQVTIPARPFLGLDAQDIAEVDDILRRHLARLAGGAQPA